MKYTKEEKMKRQAETLRVARLIRAWMARKSLTVKAAAEFLGVNPNTISKWSNGSATMSVKACLSVASKITAEVGVMSDTEMQLGAVNTAIARFPTLDLRWTALALRQHLMPTAAYAAKNSLATSYFKNGERGVNFGVQMKGLKINGADYDDHTVMMVNDNVVIPDNSLSIVFFDNPEEVLICKVRRDMADEILLVAMNGGDVIKRLPLYNDGLIGILKIDAIYQDSRIVPLSKWAHQEDFEF